MTTKKLLISRLGAGSITVALCAALPGCNLAIYPNDCVGRPSSRGMSTVACPDGAADTDGADDAAADAQVNTNGDGIKDTSKDQGSGDGR